MHLALLCAEVIAARLPFWSPLREGGVVEFLGLVADSLAWNLGQLGRLREEVRRIREAGQGRHGCSRMAEMACLILARPIFTSALVADALGVTRRTAARPRSFLTLSCSHDFSRGWHFSYPEICEVRRSMSREVPDRAETFLDHVAHFVPSLDRAAVTLEGLGFHLTPFTAQQNRTRGGIVPSGMANRCIMLREGYIEFLTAVADTELARQFRAAVARHVGAHLIAFSTGDPDAAHSSLAKNGFRPQSPVSLVRPVADEEGRPREARFAVLRVPPETMPEGRIQLLKHHTEDVVWQPRWLDHPNGIVGLKAVLLATADPEESARRFGRFVGRAPVRRQDRWLLQLDRGTCVFVEHSSIGQVAPWVDAVKSAPWIVSIALSSADGGRTRESFAAGGLPPCGVLPGEAVYRLPPELGGFVTVVPTGAEPSWSA